MKLIGTEKDIGSKIKVIRLWWKY